MESTIKQVNFHVQQWEASQNTFIHHFPETTFNSWPEFTRNSTTSDGRFKCETTTRLTRLNDIVDTTELTRTTRLFLMRVAVFNTLCNGFTVSDLWLTNDNVNAMSTLQNVYFDVQMQLTHTFHDGFATVLVSFNTERRIFFDHFTQCDTHFLGCAFIFRRNRD